ncbi:MAG: hypothetical protein LBE36_12895 [Flavobacteriaceae bacterium]|jgi:hypothetical protein|nr:hypothetical protein [Flavobacteriaceae bacterium]
MKNLFLTFVFIFAANVADAQYKSINAILDRLEERKGINQNLENVSIDDKKFVLIKDFNDHTERLFIVIKGDHATYVEIFDDKKTGESSSNVFSGDVVRSKKNVVSIRCDLLEGEQIIIPITKTLLLTKQKDILYLIDINSKERWIDEKAFGK